VEEDSQSGKKTQEAIRIASFAFFMRPGGEDFAKIFPPDAKSEDIALSKVSINGYWHKKPEQGQSCDGMLLPDFGPCNFFRDPFGFSFHG
jgi:hypothetical protein